MIKLKLSSINGQSIEDKDFEIVVGESLKDAVIRITSDLEMTDEEISKAFRTIVNGHQIESDFWEFTVLSISDTVLIAPAIMEGDNGQIIKAIALITIMAVAGPAVLGSAYFGGVASVGYGLTMAAISVTATLALNALIPPPVADTGSLGGSGVDGVSKSQMYSVTSQSNTINKYGFVPKVYGTHRIFPYIAATPYTELETDPSTGQLVQYFYCVYDLGLGKMNVEEIKIGDTPLTSFDNYQTNLVRQTAASGTDFWDYSSGPNFQLYKGDNTSTNMAVVLDKNSIDPYATESEYRVERNTADNAGLYESEIGLTFVNTQGLYGYNSVGTIGTATIDLDIEFSKVGEDVWKPYNDLDHVVSYSSVGGYSEAKYVVTRADMRPVTYSSGEGNPVSPYVVKSEYSRTSSTYTGGDDYITTVIVTKSIGLPNNTNYLWIASSNLIEVGTEILYNGNFIGKVQSIADVSDPYTKYTLDRNIPNSLILEKRVITMPQYSASPYTYQTLYDVSNFQYRNRISAKISRATQDAVYSTFKFTPKEKGQFKVRVTRKATYYTYTSTVSSSLTLVNLSTRLAVNPVGNVLEHTFLELKIKATNQLNGAVQNLSAVCTSVLDVWDGSAWVPTPTNNPAWVFCDILTGDINKRALPKARLHLPSIVEWANFCSAIPTSPPGHTYLEQRFSSNFVMDFSSTVQSLIGQVTGAAQASMNIIDGKYGVLIDRAKTVPVQVFTPRNSTGFSASRMYTVRPHALNVRFVDPGADWAVTDRVVYDDGYTALNATTFEDVQTFAVTSSEQAWRFGRYLLATNRLRQETMSINVDFENLVCTRGDYVQITQDSMKVGGTPARVRSKVGNRVVIDEGIDTSVLISYGYVFRNQTSGIVTNTLTVVNSDTFDLNGPTLPNVGDLIIIGEVTKIVYDCIVKSIHPSDNLTATLTLVERANAIFDSESTSTIPVYNPMISQTVDTNFLPPSEVVDLVVADNAYDCSGTSYIYYIDLDWDVPVGSAYEIFEIYVDYGSGYDLAGTSKKSLFRYSVDIRHLGLEHNFKVLAVSSTGKKLNLAAISQVTATPLKKTSPPSNVENFVTDITTEVLQLSWDRILDCGCQEYLIRYSPTLTGTWESSIPLLRVDRKTSTASTQARTGTYLIKAVDFNGNESALASVAITTIPELQNLNIVETIEDFPTLLGEADRVDVVDGTVRLAKSVVGGPLGDEYYSEGYYYYSNLLDMGEIYSVRLQSSIEAEGYTAEDMMNNWVSLDLVTSMSNSQFSEWDVETQYRGTEILDTMSAWNPLSDLLVMGLGDQDNWTAWKKFTLGDATFRVGQFRLKLISNKTSVTPRVFVGTIKADMTDRTESYPNVTASTSGTIINYTGSFKGPSPSPNIQITLENGQAGDYWSYDYKNLDGFKIKFFDKNDLSVARQFDAQVKGYGKKSLTVL